MCSGNIGRPQIPAHNIACDKCSLICEMIAHAAIQLIQKIIVTEWKERKHWKEASQPYRTTPTSNLIQLILRFRISNSCPPNHRSCFPSSFARGRSVPCHTRHSIGLWLSLSSMACRLRPIDTRNEVDHVVPARLQSQRNIAEVSVRRVGIAILEKPEAD
jgi:hypothetical protein